MIIVLLLIFILTCLVFVYYKKVQDVVRTEHVSTISEMQKKIALAQTTSHQLHALNTTLSEEKTNTKLAIIKNQLSMLAAIAEQD